MPTYEYECTACKHRFERTQRFSDPPITECPLCGGNVRRVLFPAGIVFKGSGWYITDSRKSTSSDSSGASPTSSAPAGGSASAESKGDGPSKSEAAAGKKSDGPSKSEAAAGKSDSAPKSEAGTSKS